MLINLIQFMPTSFWDTYQSLGVESPSVPIGINRLDAISL